MIDSLDRFRVWALRTVFVMAFLYGLFACYCGHRITSIIEENLASSTDVGNKKEAPAPQAIAVSSPLPSASPTAAAEDEPPPDAAEIALR